MEVYGRGTWCEYYEGVTEMMHMWLPIQIQHVGRIHWVASVATPCVLIWGVMELIVLGFVIDEIRFGRLGGIERSSGRLGSKDSGAFSV